MIRTLCIAALLLGTPALLAAQDGRDTCADPRTQAEMNVCAGRRFAQADSLLNQHYQHILQGMAPELVERFRGAQRAWIRFRDAECEFHTAEFQGGSIAPMIHSLCKADLTERRVEDLERIISRGR